MMPPASSRNRVPNWLARSARTYPDRMAIRVGDQEWTFAELWQRVRIAGEELREAGVKEGDVVALLAQNSIHAVVCIHALTLVGAILLPLNVRLTAEELCFQLRDTEATLLIADSHHEAVATAIGERMPEVAYGVLDQDDSPERSHAHILPPIKEADLTIDLNAIQAIMYTSGTTGTPKGVIITYGMHWWNATASALNLGIQPHDRWIAALPFFHIGGLSILLRSIIYGMGVIVHERFDAAAVNRSIIRLGGTIVSVVAVTAQRLLDNLAENGGRYPRSFRCLLLGGGPAPQPLLEACAARNIPVVQTYGMTESCSQAVTLSPAVALNKLGSAGQPLISVQLQIVDEQGQPVEAGVAGEVWLRGPGITPGYYKRPEATASAFHDDWFATGDIGYLDRDGYLYILDRRSDLIISGGENIYPAEIEAVLLGHPAVADVGVRGMSDAQWGQVPAAYIVVREQQSVTADELRAWTSARLAKYKVPRTFTFVSALPRTSSGKVIRRALGTDS